MKTLSIYPCTTTLFLVKMFFFFFFVKFVSACIKFCICLAMVNEDEVVYVVRMYTHNRRAALRTRRHIRTKRIRHGR